MTNDLLLKMLDNLQLDNHMLFHHDHME
ncbi:uncharacterized protein METZ01_LOCUS382974 [marine metagenome]|uniref:Uncharacterized protein n=1 Tax=marine metagenome TaxID=408172 RepID=A0A382U756_9ZZZZ